MFDKAKEILGYDLLDICLNVRMFCFDFGIVAELWFFRVRKKS